MLTDMERRIVSIEAVRPLKSLGISLITVDNAGKIGVIIKNRNNLLVGMVIDTITIDSLDMNEYVLKVVDVLKLRLQARISRVKGEMLQLVSLSPKVDTSQLSVDLTAYLMKSMKAYYMLKGIRF